MKASIAILLLVTLSVAQTIGASTSKSYESFRSASQVTENIYMIFGPMGLPSKSNRGFRNNPIIILVEKGVVIVDPGGSAVAGRWVLNQIKLLTSDPVVAVFNSHSHGGHWMANEVVRDAFPNVPIYGHPKTKSYVESADGERWLELTNRFTEGSAESTRVVGPDRTVVDRQSIEIGNERFRIYHPHAAHSDSDILIEVVSQNAIIAGDIIRNQFLGTMGEESSFEESIATLDFILSKDYEYYIPGHGPGEDYSKALAENFRRYLKTLVDEVQKHYDDGLSDFEMKPLIIKTLSEYENWVGFDIRVGQHIRRAIAEFEENAF